MANVKDLAGQVFGRLTALRMAGMDDHGKAMWECSCECGAVKVVCGSHLRNGHTKSCGCFRRDTASADRTEHGMTGSPEWRAWNTMKRRCGEAAFQGYQNYGGRGIAVCNEWIDSFESFFAHVGPRPSRGHSIDRVDVNGNYEPGNVRWATREEQNRNRRSNILITAHGKTLTAAEWSRSMGMSNGAVRMRIRRGDSPEQAVLGIQPRKPGRRKAGQP